MIYILQINWKFPPFFAPRLKKRISYPLVSKPIKEWTIGVPLFMEELHLLLLKVVKSLFISPFSYILFYFIFKNIPFTIRVLFLFCFFLDNLLIFMKLKKIQLYVVKTKKIHFLCGYSFGWLTNVLFLHRNISYWYNKNSSPSARTNHRCPS